MARKTLTPAASAAPLQTDAIGDPGALWNQWLAGQRDLLGSGFEQMAQSQQVLLQAWMQWVQVCWAPWVPFLERGGEQLA